MIHISLVAILFAALRKFGFLEWQMVSFFVCVFYSLIGVFRGPRLLGVLLIGFLFGMGAEFICLAWVASIGPDLGNNPPLNLFFPFSYYMMRLEAVSPRGLLFGQGTDAFTLSRVWGVLFLTPIATGLCFVPVSFVSWTCRRRPSLRQFAKSIACYSIITALCVAMFSLLFGHGWLRWIYTVHSSYASCVFLTILSAPFIGGLLKLPGRAKLTGPAIPS